MRRLAEQRDFDELARRIRAFTPESPRLWGQMSCSQMICHLADAFRRPLGERPAAALRDTWFTRTFLRWLVLRTPLPWARGASTSPDIDQVAGQGTPPGQFSKDVSVLLALMRRFIVEAEPRPPHSLFGPLSASEWARWGWAHVDLHLRQFGA